MFSSYPCIQFGWFDSPGLSHKFLLVRQFPSGTQGADHSSLQKPFRNGSLAQPRGSCAKALRIRNFQALQGFIDPIHAAVNQLAEARQSRHARAALAQVAGLFAGASNGLPYRSLGWEKIIPARDPKQCGGAKGEETSGDDDYDDTEQT